MRLSVSRNNSVTIPLYQILLAVTIAQIVNSFNLDLNSSVILKPPDQEDIQFGFSLAFVFNGTERRLLVGAPKANTTQVRVSNPGALYSCVIDKTPAKCNQLQVDTRNADDKYKSWITVDNKDEQRLGYTLAANDKNVVVCAPRWHAFRDVFSRLRDLPMGICFKADAPNFNTYEAFSPPFDSSAPTANFNNNGSCQFGMSMTNFKDSSSVGFGSPGCWTWQGDIWNIDLNNPEDIGSYERAMNLDLADFELTYDPNMSQNIDGIQRYSSLSDLYLGYSIASMTYAEVPTLVSAMPRTYSTNELRVVEQEQVVGPMVYIFEISKSKKLRVLDRIKPPMNKTTKQEASLNTMFSYFGYSLTTADVNGDGLEDVIVGAPFYHNDTHYDQGAIFVYTQQRFEAKGEVPYEFKMEGEENAPKRMGGESYGRFGSALATIGDLDSDGYEDIAVGAPFLEGGGAVFIYFGSSSGLEVLYGQMITASELPSVNQPVSGFGFSIAQRLPDQSKRRFDLAVGAYNSDTVLVFRSKEVAVVSSNMTFNENMDLTENKCIYTDPSPAKYPCVQSEVCLLYKINSATTSKQPLKFALKLQADVDYPKARLFFENGEKEIEKQFELYEGVRECESITIHAKKDMPDVITPFVIRREVSLGKQNSDMFVLDPRTALSERETLDILVKCEGEEARLCQSDLQLTSTVLRNYTLSSSDPVIMHFLVENKGEPAYNTRLTITSQGDLRYQNSGSSITCDDKGVDLVECNLGAISHNSKAEFNLTMTPSDIFFNSLETKKDYFEVTATLSTASEIVSPENTNTTFNISIYVDGTLDLTREPSVPGIANYNGSSYYKSPSYNIREEELGPEVTHTYKIYNSHKYSIYKTNITIRWPLKIDGKYLLYLMEMPSFTGSAPECHYTNGEVNEFNLTKVNEALMSSGNFSRGPSVGAVRLGSGLNFPGIGINGKTVEYMEFRCALNTIEKLAEISIKLRSRLVLRTIKELEVGTNLRNVSSWVSLQVLQLPLGAPLPPPSIPSSISTEISYKLDEPGFKVPWWLYLVAVLVGLLLLAILILILWKCGFFKRKKTPVVDGTDGDGNGEECEKGDDENEEEDPVTPTSPMLKETEAANDDFEFRQSKNY